MFYDDIISTIVLHFFVLKRRITKTTKRAGGLFNRTRKIV